MYLYQIHNYFVALYRLITIWQGLKFIRFKVTCNNIQYYIIVTRVFADCLHAHTFISIFSHIHWSFIFFSLDDVKTTLFLLTRAHITKDYILQHSLLIIEAHTHMHICMSKFSRYVVPNIEGEREHIYTHTRKVNTPTGADAVRKTYTAILNFSSSSLCVCACARSFSSNNIAAE